MHPHVAMTEPGVGAWRGKFMMERALDPIEIVQAHYRTRLLAQASGARAAPLPYPG
jgi:acyl-CoA hydrolase